MLLCSGVVLEKVCEYLYYNRKHQASRDVPHMDIPAELCLELLVAADYLNCESIVWWWMEEMTDHEVR